MPSRHVPSPALPRPCPIPVRLPVVVMPAMPVPPSSCPSFCSKSPVFVTFLSVHCPPVPNDPVLSVLPVSNNAARYKVRFQYAGLFVCLKERRKYPEQRIGKCWEKGRERERYGEKRVCGREKRKAGWWGKVKVAGRQRRRKQCPSTNHLSMSIQRIVCGVQGCGGESREHVFICRQAKCV